MTPFKGGKLTTWEGGMRAPMVIRWSGVIKPGTVHSQIFSCLDWVLTLVDIAGGAKGDALKKQGGTSSVLLRNCMSDGSAMAQSASPCCCP